MGAFRLPQAIASLEEKAHKKTVQFYGLFWGLSLAPRALAVQTLGTTLIISHLSAERGRRIKGF
jgi:hypothetical protein